MEQNYQAIANNLKDIRAREYTQRELIRALCKKLGKVKPDELEVTIDNLPTRKKVDELEAKNSFLLEKANKLKAELKEEKKEHEEAIDELNSILLFNQKLHEYVGNLGDVVNKACTFDENLAKHPISAAKVILVFVDLVEKMEELLNDMRGLFDKLQPKALLVVTLENLPDLSGEIPSLTGWGRDAAPTETPTKLDQPRPSKPTKETEQEKAPHQTSYDTPPQRQVVEPVMTRREI